MIYYTAKLVFRSVSKITDADWLLNGPIFYDVGPIGPVHFYFGPVCFGGNIFDVLSTYDEKF